MIYGYIKSPFYYVENFSVEKKHILVVKDIFVEIV